MPVSLSGTFPRGYFGVPYSYTPTTSGGTPPYSYSLVSGQLPPGLSLNAATGEVSGTPIDATFALAAGAAAATGSALATGAALYVVTATSVGLGAASAQGAALAPRAASSSGIGAATAPSVSIATATGTASALGGQSSASVSLVFRAASASGAGAASAQSLAIATVAASSSALGSASSQGVALLARAAASSGVGSAAASGVKLAASTGAAAALGSASSSAIAIASLSASASGTGAGSATGLAAFTPKSLFPSQEQGIWFDPQDLSTLFQDTSAATAAAVGQPVGLALDKRIDAGFQVITIGNLTFTKTTAYGTLSQNGNQITVTNADTVNMCEVLVTNSNASGMGTIGFTGGKTFPGLGRIKWSAQWVSGSGNTPTTRLWYRGAPQNPFVSSTTQNSGAIVTTLPLTQGDYDALTVTGGAITFTISEVAYCRGNHLQQGTSSKKLVLRQDASSKYYLEPDGFDDFMPSPFTITQPWDRFSAISHINSSAHTFGGASANAGVLLESVGFLRLYDGSTLVGPSWAASTGYAIEEHHSGTSSYIREDGGSLTSGNSGTTLPGGVTLSALYTGGANFSSARHYGFVMRQGSVTTPEANSLRTYYGALIGKAL